MTHKDIWLNRVFIIIIGIVITIPRNKIELKSPNGNTTIVIEATDEGGFFIMKSSNDSTVKLISKIGTRVLTGGWSKLEYDESQLRELQKEFK